MLKNIWPKISEQQAKIRNLDRAVGDVADLSKQNTQVITDANVIATRNELEDFIQRTENRFKVVFKPVITVGKKFEHRIDALQKEMKDNENKV